MMAEQALSRSPRRLTRISVTSTIAWAGAIGFAGLVVGLLAVDSGHIVELAFPVAALLVGTVLYFLHPTLYLGFTWWLWFLAPEVRRIVDYQIGWNPISPVMLAPYLVSGIAALTLVRRLPQLLHQPGLFPFALILMALNYAFTIGIVRAGPLPATYGLLTWIVPVVFGFHVAVNWQYYPLYRDAIRRVFMWGVLVMGVYGIVQFFVVPPWDAYWLEVAPIGSAGRPVPFEVRVWSTMNAPSPFACVMMAGLLFAFAAKGPLRFVAGVAGYVSFLLSLVRTAWLGWAIGAVFLLVRVGGVQRMRLLLAGTLLGLFSLPLLHLDPVAETVTNRFATVEQIQDDVSFRARLVLYRDFILVSLTNVIGEGIGSTRQATKLANEGELGALGNLDSGILETFFVLGWPGTILFLGGICWLLCIALSGRAQRQDPAVQAAGAIVLAAFAMTTSLNTLIGVAGMIFWTFLGLALSGKAFHSTDNLVLRAGMRQVVQKNANTRASKGAPPEPPVYAPAVGETASGER